MHVSSAAPVALRSREYYLNHFRNADRVTTHGYLLLDGDTAIDTSEGRYKTGNFTGLSLQFSMPMLFGLLCVPACKV